VAEPYRNEPSHLTENEFTDVQRRPAGPLFFLRTPNRSDPAAARPKEVRVIACEMDGMFGMSWLMWFPGFLVFLILVGLWIWAVVRLAHRPGGGALQVLEQRLARGKIDAEEFRERRTILEEAR